MAILDSGTSCAILPTDVYDATLDILVSYLSYTEYDDWYGWGYLFYCNEIDSLPTIDILYGGYWMEVLVDDYVVNFGDGTCAFCLSDSGDPNMAILGDAVMKNYYIIHDYDYGDVGIVPLANTPTIKAALVSGSVPSCEIGTGCSGSSSSSEEEDALSTAAKIILIVLCVVFVAGIAALVWFFWWRPR